MANEFLVGLVANLLSASAEGVARSGHKRIFSSSASERVAAVCIDALKDAVARANPELDDEVADHSANLLANWITNAFGAEGLLFADPSEVPPWATIDALTRASPEADPATLPVDIRDVAAGYPAALSFRLQQAIIESPEVSSVASVILMHDVRSLLLRVLDGVTEVSTSVGNGGRGAIDENVELRFRYLFALDRSLRALTVPDLGYLGRARVFLRKEAFVPLRLDELDVAGEYRRRSQVDLYEVIHDLMSERRVAQLTGPLGAGKSSLAHEITAYTSERARLVPELVGTAPTPFLVHAEELRRSLEGEDDLGAAIGKAAHQRVDGLSLDEVRSLLRQSLDMGVAFIVIDALDEQRGSASEATMLWNRIVSEQAGGVLDDSTVLMTTREHLAILDDRAQRYRTAELEESSARLLAMSYLRMSHGAGSSGEGAGPADLADAVVRCMLDSTNGLLRTPLHSMLLAWIATASGETSQALGRLDGLRRPGQVYSFYVDSVLAWERAKGASGGDDAGAVLGRHAVRQLLGTEAAAELLTASGLPSRQDDLDLWRRVGVLVPRAGEMQDAFRHRDLALFALSTFVAKASDQNLALGLLEGSLADDEIVRVVEFVLELSGEPGL